MGAGREGCSRYPEKGVGSQGQDWDTGGLDPRVWSRENRSGDACGQLVLGPTGHHWFRMTCSIQGWYLHRLV